MDGGYGRRRRRIYSHSLCCLPSPIHRPPFWGFLQERGNHQTVFTVFNVVNVIDAGECESLESLRCSHLGPIVDPAPHLEVAGSSPASVPFFYYLLHSFTCSIARISPFYPTLHCLWYDYHNCIYSFNSFLFVFILDWCNDYYDDVFRPLPADKKPQK